MSLSKYDIDDLAQKLQDYNETIKHTKEMKSKVEKLIEIEFEERSENKIHKQGGRTADYIDKVTKKITSSIKVSKKEEL